MLDVCFDATSRRSSRSIRQSLSLTILMEIDGKSIENRLRMWFCTEVGLKINLGSISAAILPSWDCFWELLGDLGRPLRLPWETLGRSRGALGGSWALPGLPGDPPGTHLGTSWAPWASQGGSGRVLTSQNHEKSIDFGRFLHHVSVPKSVANLLVCAPMLVPKSLSKRVWPSILGRWRRHMHAC